MKPEQDSGDQHDAPQRKIIHVDMDAFFASVEQRDDPALRGKPVAVGGLSKRGVVAAASYEARKFGVRSAMPSFKAKDLCRHLIFVPPRFDVYRSVSAQIHEVFREHTDIVEPLSLDEAYLDVTTNKKGLPYARDVARDIRRRIEEVTGLTASAGVSYQKFLAKMASGMNKPNGMTIITPEMGPAFMESLAIERFHGVGPATAERMRSHGIASGLDLKARSLDELVSIFGKSGRYFYDLARGIDLRAVQTHRERKSIGAEDTFSDDIEDIDDAKMMLRPLVQKVWGISEKKQMRGRTATVKIKFANFEQITRSHSLPHAFEDMETFWQTCQRLVEGEHPFRMPVRLIGATLSSFDGEHSEVDEAQLAFDV